MVGCEGTEIVYLALTAAPQVLQGPDCLPIEDEY